MDRNRRGEKKEPTGRYLFLLSSNSLIIHQVKTLKTRTAKEVLIPGLN